MATKKIEGKIEEQTAITTTTPGTLVAYDYGDDEGAGFSHQTKDDYSIPFVTLMQALTPAVVDRTHPMALSGNMFNTVTEEYVDGVKGFLFVPGTTKHVFARWVPRDEGGGFRGHLDPEDKRVLEAIENAKKFGKYATPDEENEGKKLQLTETFYVYGAVCDENGAAKGMALLAYTSTKIANYKTWMTRMRNVRNELGQRPPMWANLTRITAKSDRNNKGQFFTFGMSPGDPRGMQQSLLAVEDERFQLAKACAELVRSGKAKVDYAQSGGDSESEAQPF